MRVSAGICTVRSMAYWLRSVSASTLAELVFGGDQGMVSCANETQFTVLKAPRPPCPFPEISCFLPPQISWYILDTVTAPFPENMVFAVYMNSRLYIYDARAEYCASDDTLCPVDWQNRYEGLVWKSTS